MVDRAAVMSAYELLLDRTPESEMIIEEKLNCPNEEELVLELASSYEFFVQNRDVVLMLFG